VNAANKSGWTPFRMAHLMKKPDVLKVLVSAGASIDGDWLVNKTACGKCHANEISGIALRSAQFVPHLAGQHSDYIVKQLRAFMAGDRAHGLEGYTAGNTYYAPEMLLEEFIVPIADYVQNLDRFDNSQVTKTDNHDAGSIIYSNQCASCHGDNGIDTINSITPELAGLYSLYTFNTLGLFKGNIRAHGVDSALSEEEMQAVADYISAM